MDADGFVDCSCGNRHWGRNGAAGVLAWREGEVLAQLRAPRSISGGTWGFPGGAIAWAETPIAGALREAREEAGLKRPRIWATTTEDHGPWSYTSVLAEAAQGQRACATDRESSEIAWLAWPEFCSRELMGAVADSLPLLGALLGRCLLVADIEVDPSALQAGIPLEALPAAHDIAAARAACPGRRSVRLFPAVADDDAAPASASAATGAGYRYVFRASQVDWAAAGLAG
ncbi:MAG: NUDIX hydrolase [Flaviflexus sp.]|nr:NUDIX hydrolase [Flaviflexus sp.]